MGAGLKRSPRVLPMLYAMRSLHPANSTIATATLEILLSGYPNDGRDMASSPWWSPKAIMLALRLRQVKGGCHHLTLTGPAEITRTRLSGPRWPQFRYRQRRARSRTLVSSEMKRLPRSARSTNGRTATS
jgi:hypothetical protein